MEARFGGNERNIPTIIISLSLARNSNLLVCLELRSLGEMRAVYRVILWRNFFPLCPFFQRSFVSRLFYFDRASGEEEKVKEGTAL